MTDEEALQAMHDAADVVAEKLKPFLTRAAIDALDCTQVLLAGQEWLGDDDPNVEKLRQAIHEYAE